MQIKLWQKVVFFGSIGALIVYLQREKVFKAYAYGKKAFGDLVNMFASQWVGVKEIGENQAFGNEAFQSMMKQVGWHSFDQWCMYFAKAVHYNVFKDNPTEQAKINKVLVGNTQLAFNNAKNDTSGTYQAITSGSPKVGDIIIFRHSNAPSTGHAAVVVKVNSNDTVDTIEGNTSDKSISNGDVVAKKNRTSIIGKSIGGDLVVRGFIRKLNV
jgi:surface antigen